MGADGRIFKVEGEHDRAVHFKCTTCGDAIGDIVCDDGKLFNKCRCCGALKKRRKGRGSKISDAEREKLESLVKELTRRNTDAVRSVFP